MSVIRSRFFELMIGVEMEKSIVISPHLACQSIFKSSIETEGLRTIIGRITNRPDAVFAAVTLDRLRSDGCDLQAANDARYEAGRRVA